mmetsp:Transcript_29972/g.96706  ORF Transcript_29972/g.96706 Transcript_29972/m.96706 type:complete len:150 (+) Transcript_29972:67-516(+)
MELARDILQRFKYYGMLLLSRDVEEEEDDERDDEFVTKCGGFFCLCPALTPLPGHLWRVDSNGRWVRRWFELREDVLASYKSEDRTKLKNAIKVSKISRIRLVHSAKDDKPRDFVMHCGNSTYPFQGETPEDAAAWVAIIEKRMRRVPQ